MIHGIGVLHSTVKPEYLQNALAELDPDKVFVEGSRPEYSKAIFNINYENIKTAVNKELEPEKDFEELIEDVDSLRAGREADYLENDTNFPKKDIIFLDEDIEKQKQIYCFIEGFSEYKESQFAKQKITEEDLRKTLDDHKTNKDDVKNYLRYLTGGINGRDNELVYSSMRGEESFQAQIEKIGSNLNLSSYATDSLDSIIEGGLDLRTNYEDEFNEVIANYNIGLEDLQKVIGSEREETQLKKDIQDKRDESWSRQITSYLEKNPDDEIMVIAGLDHLLDIPNRTTSLLKNENFEVETYAIKDF